MPTKSANYDQGNIEFVHNFSYFCFGNKLFSTFVICSCFILARCKRKVVSGSRVTLPEHFACKPGPSFNPLARVTLAEGLSYPLVNRALESHCNTFQLPNEIRRRILRFETSSRFDWQLRTEITKFVANFGNFKRMSETVCQKFCEMHCKVLILSFGGFRYLCMFARSIDQSWCYWARQSKPSERTETCRKVDIEVYLLPNDVQNN